MPLCPGGAEWGTLPESQPSATVPEARSFCHNPSLIQPLVCQSGLAYWWWDRTENWRVFLEEMTRRRGRASPGQTPAPCIVAYCAWAPSLLTRF